VLRTGSIISTLPQFNWLLREQSLVVFPTKTDISENITTVRPLTQDIFQCLTSAPSFALLCAEWNERFHSFIDKAVRSTPRQTKTRIALQNRATSYSGNIDLAKVRCFL